MQKNFIPCKIANMKNCVNYSTFLQVKSTIFATELENCKVEFAKSKKTN